MVKMITGSIQAKLIAIMLVMFALLVVTATSVAAQDRPNILVIWGDDIGQYNISAYNMGVGSYNIYQYAEAVDLGLRYRPRYLLIGLFPANDFEFGVCRLLRTARWRDWFDARGLERTTCREADDRRLQSAQTTIAWLPDLAASTALGSAIETLFWRPYLRPHVRATYVLRVGHKRQLIEQERVRALMSQTDPMNRFVSNGLANLAKLFDEMTRAADAQGTRVGVLVVPSKVRVVAGWARAEGVALPEPLRLAYAHEQLLVSRIRDVLGELSIPVEDAGPDMERLMIEARSEVVLYPVGDGHPYANGYRAYAEAGLRLLDRMDAGAQRHDERDAVDARN